MCLGLKAAAENHLRELTLLRRVRDRIDTGFARPLDLEALARTVGLPVALFVRRFQDAYGLSPHDYRRAAEAIRNREARAARPKVA
ncbi:MULTISPECIES: AraC family transcriptional regulator [unclassified Amycolatopsis]|uniref:AraC family transcriptional regulator n=1 Tax=unclassified Amycolatopsis TaxID=2618356 RepID=UPI0028749E1B|nr:MULTISPECIES: AraC family transcriptional regulator [unclassified Amycolatopsis]MDS0138353.1 helix-turn-helix transcriptional regulator [Amycolatopsis sp. 505]MDS0146370.1 helix-turn-helix transcriptional regulator [Amycolatopsis sp. CM201R]